MVGLALLASSCAQGLAFRQDDRLEITAPKPRTDVTLPLTIRWRVDDFRITGPGPNAEPDAGYFALFLDRTPVPPGERLSWLARDDRRCKAVPGCPDATYLADRGAHTTNETFFTFDQLPIQDVYSGHETHEATVVLLDATGRRIGESAWFVTFRYDRPGG